MAEQPFADWAPKYRERGFQPRPITSGSKACKLRNWQTPDAELPETVKQSWLKKYADFGIGLLLGSPLPGGGILGGLDIDHDDYGRLAEAALGNPTCGRVGARGALYFVRVRGELSYREFKLKPEGGDAVKVGELLCSKRLAVIPPTVHPTTNQPYRWLGAPLLEVDLATLPIIEV